MKTVIQTLSIKTRILNQFRKVFMLPFFEQILLKKTINKNTENLFVKMIPPKYLYKANTVRNIVRNGIRYSTDLSDYVEHAIYWGIVDEGHDLLYKHIKSGMIIFDVGANIGDTALRFAKLTGETGQVYSFEPDSVNYKKLRLNIENNSFKNIHTYNIGLGSKNSIEKLYRVNPENKGMNRIMTSENSSSEFTEINIRTIDDIVNESSIKRVDLLKIDVEGFEFEVLNGAKTILQKFKPVLFIEIDEQNLKQNNTTPKNLFNFLISAGYTITIAQRQQIISGNESNWINAHFDILCMPQ